MTNQAAESKETSGLGAFCVVEQDAAIRGKLKSALEAAGSLRVYSTASASAGWQWVVRHSPEAMVVGTPEGPMDAATLMRRVQNRCPQVVRVVLSDDEPVQVFRRMPYAHQFFGPAVPPSALAIALRECIQLGELLRRPTLKELVSSKNSLPATPKLYSQLIEKLGDPRCSLVKVAEIIEQDVAMSARLLQVVSSAFFGLSGEMRSIGACVAYLGTDTIRALVLSEEISRDFPVSGHGFSAEGLQSRAMSMSRLTRRLASNIAEPGQAFIVGLLHGVGQLVLASRAPEQFSEVSDLAASAEIPVGEAEARVFGATSAEVGAYLLGLWGLPGSVVRAVAAQDSPEMVDFSEPGLASIAYLGKRLSLDPNAPLVDDIRSDSGVYRPYLEQVGIADRLAGWRDMAIRLAS